MDDELQKEEKIGLIGRLCGSNGHSTENGEN